MQVLSQNFIDIKYISPCETLTSNSEAADVCRFTISPLAILINETQPLPLRETMSCICISTDYSNRLAMHNSTPEY